MIRCLLCGRKYKTIKGMAGHKCRKLDKYGNYK